MSGKILQASFETSKKPQPGPERVKLPCLVPKKDWKRFVEEDWTSAIVCEEFTDHFAVTVSKEEHDAWVQKRVKKIKPKQTEPESPKILDFPCFFGSYRPDPNTAA